mgnify:CR=1 FL=1
MFVGAQQVSHLPHLVHLCFLLSTSTPPSLQPNKRHPSDPFTAGRVRYQLDRDGVLIVDDVASKPALARLLAKHIASTPMRLELAKNKANAAAAAAAPNRGQPKAPKVKKIIIRR